MRDSVQLKEIAEFIKTGKTPPTAETKYFNGSLKWFTPTDLDNGKYLSNSQRTLSNVAVAENKAVVYPENTLLVACIGDIGKLGITKEESSSNQQITGIKPKNNVNVDYLYYWFRGNKKLVQHYSNNAVVPIINNKTLEKIKIPLPPLDQQKQIAQVLDAADELRQKNKAIIEKYNELAQSLFLEMFGDVRKNEHDYPIEKLASICDVRDGTHDSPKYQDEGYPLVTSKNIKNGKIELENINYISKEDYDNINKRSKVDIGDIIMPMIGTIGNPLLVINDVNYAIKNVALFKPVSNEKLNFKYLLEILSGFYFEEYVKAKNKGGTQKFVSLGDLRNLALPLPPIELQNEFVEQIEIIEKQKEQAEQSLQKSDELFNSLLQKAFRGELG